MNEVQTFSLLLSIPLEITEQIFLTFLDGLSLSTLALALHCSRSFDREDDGLQTDETGICNIQRVSKLIDEVAKKRLLEIATSIEESSRASTAAAATRDSNDNFRTLIVPAINWIRSVVEFSFLGESTPLGRMRVVSENLALVDFLEHSIQAYSAAPAGLFEWPVWVGQISVDFYVEGSRMRNTARVVITSPMQSPVFSPGCNLIQNRVPAGNFRCEHYNMIPVPPWGRVRALTQEDSRVLRPVAERLEQVGQVAVPASFHVDEILDIRIASTSRARELLQSMSWTPRGSWILQDCVNNRNHVDSLATGLVCLWQEDTMEMTSDRQYITYAIDLLKAMERMKT